MLKKHLTLNRSTRPYTTKKDAYSSVFFWVDSGARTHDTRNHNPMLCQLSYNHHIAFLSKASAKVLLFFDMTKYFGKKMRLCLDFNQNMLLLHYIYDHYA